MVAVLEAADAEERLGEAAVTNLVLTLRAAAVKACGGMLVAHVDGRYDCSSPPCRSARSNRRVFSCGDGILCAEGGPSCIWTGLHSGDARRTSGCDAATR